MNTFEPIVRATSTFTVNSIGDTLDVIPGDGNCRDLSGVCTLRAAIQEANSLAGTDTINFSVTGTINLTSALPDITSNMTINGPGSSLLTVRRDTGGDYRIFFTNNRNVNISGMTINNGRTPDGVSGSSDGGSAQSGGGISQAGGEMILTDVVITGNRTGNGGSATGGSNSFGGLGGFGGGISSSGKLTMLNCVVSNNITGNGGTGGYGRSGGYGGGIYFAVGTLTLTNVSITGNRTGDGGIGIGGGLSGGNSGYGGGISSGVASGGGDAVLNMTNVTINNNSTGNVERGDAGWGGGFIIFSGTAMLNNSTVSHNRTGSGTGYLSAGGLGGGISNSGTLTVTNSLISNNTTGNSDSSSGASGGGIQNGFILTLINSTVSGNSTGSGSSSSGSGAGIISGAILNMINSTITGNSAFGNTANGVFIGNTANVRNTIIAGNGVGNGRDTSGTFTSLGHNLIGNADGSSGFTGSGDQVGTSAAPINPQLGPLADNGGPTLTHALLAGSPALDAGNNALAKDAGNNTLTSDQRGAGRFANSAGTGALATVDIGAFEFHPSLENVSDKTTNEDIPLSILFNIGDGAAGVASVAASSDNQALVPNANLAVTGTGPVRTLQITPAANQSGTANITLTVTGSGRQATSDTFLLTVTPVNDAPTFVKGANQIVSEDSVPQNVESWATGISAGPGESGQSLSFLVTGNTNPGLFSAGPSVSPSGALTFTPAANANGSATVMLTLKDDGGMANGGQDTSAAQSFTITITPVNDPPVTSGQTIITSEDSSRVITLTGSDVDGDSLTFSIVSSPARGTLSGSGASRIYTPAVNFNGSDSFTFKAVDPSGAESAVTTVEITITAVNDAPVNTVPGAQITNQQTPLVFSAAGSNAISVADVDAGPDPIRVTLSTTGATLTLGATTGLTFSAGDGVDDAAMTFVGTISSANAALNGLTFNPNAGFSGTTSLQLMVNDQGYSGSGGARSDTDFITITVRLSSTLQFSQANYEFSEGAGRATIVITRTGSLSVSTTVEFQTVDDPAAVPCGTVNGVAYARCDYATTIDTVTFGPNEGSKEVIVPLVDDAHVEGSETIQLRLRNATGTTITLGAQSSATLTISDNDAAGAANPILTTPFFVRMQYLDFLSREPEAGEPWSGVLNRCSDVNNDPSCDRILVSSSFFGSPEFRLKGFFVYTFYRVAFDRRPEYAEIIPDMRNVTGLTPSDTFTRRAAFPVSFVQRQEFRTAYDGLSNVAFVGALLDRYELQSITTPDPQFPESGVRVTLSRADLVTRLGTTGTQALTRAQVLRAIVESDEVGAREFNGAFVAMQYYGYLRRTPEAAGYEAWLRVINQDPQNVRIMVNGFMNSIEYRLRFGTP